MKRIPTIGKYILDDDGKTPVPCEDLLEWGQWMELQGKRIVKQTRRAKKRGPLVSTVFLGLDHDFPYNSEEPILWETMVFGGPWRYEPQERYTSYEDAVVGHERWVRKTKTAYMLYPFFWVADRVPYWLRGINWRRKLH